MQETIQAGTVLIREGTVLPEGLAFETEPCSFGWQLVTGLNACVIERKTHDSGWSFFYLAGECRANVFGHEGQKTVRKAISQILAGLKSGKFNALEITRVDLKHFLGMPYTTVSFHMRNVQESMFLLGGGLKAWNDARFVAA